MKVNIGKFPSIRSKKERKVDIHIDDFDVWSADHTLAMIIVPILKKLRDSKHGSPVIPDEDVPAELRGKEDEEGNFEAKWDYVLNQMIWAFEQTLNDDWEEQFVSGKADFSWNPIEINNSKFYELKEGPNHTYKYDRESAEEYRKKIVEGRILFAKYFNALWD